MNESTDTLVEPALSVQIEALLFALGKPLSRAELLKILGSETLELEEALETLRQSTKVRGVVLVDDGNLLELRVSPQSATLVERIRKEDSSREIGRAGLEVLAAILYRGPLTRSEIDFIRGVNSSQTIRTLMTRGLVRKATQSKGGVLAGARQSSFPYEPTTQLLATLGVTHISDLPDYATVRDKLTALEVAYRQLASTHTDDGDTA